MQSERTQFYSQQHQKNKMLRTILTKEVSDFYTENCKTLLRLIKEHLNKWSHFMFMGWKAMLLR